MTNVNSPNLTGVGIKTVVANPLRKAMTVVDATGNDVFRVYGDGIVWATEVNVRLKGSFPDYVFDEEYSLMPLRYLDKYIEQYGHLPNVPTAKTVEKEGVNLGEMNRVLMEKVEELTLYLIDLQKQILELKKTIENENK